MYKAVCVCVCGVGVLNHEHWQQRGVRMSNEKVTAAVLSLGYRGSWWC